MTKKTPPLSLKDLLIYYELNPLGQIKAIKTACELIENGDICNHVTGLPVKTQNTCGPAVAIAYALIRELAL